MDTFLPNERGKNRLEGTCTLLLRESLSLSLSALPFSARAGLKYASPLSSMLQFNFATSLRRGGGEEGRGGELCPAPQARGLGLHPVWLGCDERVYVSALQTTLV